MELIIIKKRKNSQKFKEQQKLGKNTSNSTGYQMLLLF